MPTPSIYAYHRALNPATGDVLFDTTRSTWQWGHPVAEIAARALRTPLGSAQRDPSYGLDLEGIDFSQPNAFREFERRVRKCLDRYVKLGTMTVSDVRAEIHGSNVWAVAQIGDPRDTSGVPVPPTRVLIR